MKEYIRRRKWLILFVPVFMIASVGFMSRESAGDDYFEISKNLDIFGKLYREIHSYYVDDVDPTTFMRTGIDAMLNSLDPYTNYISASEIEEYRFMSTGQYGGIGATVGKRNGKVLITEPYKGRPADKAGLRAGDEILQVDEEKITVDNYKSLDVRDLLRGQSNTSVTLTIQREGEDPMKVDVIREDIKIDNVPYHGMIDKKIGYISLTGFTNGASGEVKSAYEELRKDNPGLQGVVIDLRGNPGGLLFEAIDISNIFVRQGEKIVETRGKIEGSLKTYNARQKAVDTSVPLAVLINRRSASASEIVSGVMQDLDRGVIVGQQSFGKGLVQTTRPLSYNSQLKVTTAKYYTPSGRCIQAIDYSNRNDDGSVGKIPDSLKKAFTTLNGRTVYDGGGVAPDLKVELPDYHTVTTELMRQSMVFDFASRYRNKHESIPGPREFQITDEIYNEFLSFLEEKEFKFATKTEKEFDRLKDLMKEEEYLNDLSSELEALKAKLEREKKADLTEFRDEIANFLKTEIVNRYYFKEGEIEASFDMDPDVLQAVRILNNQDEYQRILAGN